MIINEIEANSDKLGIKSDKNEKSLFYDFFWILILLEDYEFFEIENGIIGIKRDAFLKLTQYMEWSKLRFV
jgi:hypothetical protein